MENAVALVLKCIWCLGKNWQHAARSKLFFASRQLNCQKLLIWKGAKTCLK